MLVWPSSHALESPSDALVQPQQPHTCWALGVYTTVLYLTIRNAHSCTNPVQQAPSRGSKFTRFCMSARCVKSVPPVQSVKQLRPHLNSNISAFRPCYADPSSSTPSSSTPSSSPPAAQPPATQPQWPSLQQPNLQHLNPGCSTGPCSSTPTAQP